MKNKQQLLEIISTYGKHAQLLQAVEEMSELTKELIKNINRNAANIGDIFDEIADVSLMLDQLIIIFDIKNTHLEYAKEAKVTRTLDRIKYAKRKA